MSQQKTAGPNGARIIGMRVSAIRHPRRYPVGAEIQRDSLLIQHEHALAHAEAIHPDGEKWLCRTPASSSSFGTRLVRAAVGINDEMSYGMLNIQLPQGNLTAKYADNLDRYSRMIHVSVGDISWFLQSMNGEVIELELESRKVPYEILELDSPPGHVLQLADEALPHPLAERTAVQIKDQAGDHRYEPDADAKLYPARTARRFGCFVVHRMCYCLAASVGPVTCNGSVCTSEMSGVFLSSPESGNDGSKV